MGDELTYGDMLPEKPDRGYVAGYLNIGIAELSFGADQDGYFFDPSLGALGVNIDSEGNVGWSIPLGVATIG